MRYRLAVVVALLAACKGSAGTPAPSLDCDDTGDWPMFGKNLCNTRAGSGGSLSPATAPKLGVKWTFDATGDVSATPAVVGGYVYVPDWGGAIHKIDATTGQAVWTRSVDDLVAETGDGGVKGVGFL